MGNIYIERLKDLSEKVGVEVIGYVSEDKIVGKTKLKLRCKEHNIVWETTNIVNFLMRKKNPCKECGKQSRKVIFTEKESVFLPKVLKACEKYNTTFISWNGDYKGVTSKLVHKCNKHGTITKDTDARSLVSGRNKTSGCTDCHKEVFKITVDTKIKKHIQTFKDTGCFVEGTVFKKSEKITTKGVRSYWRVFCPTCKESNEVFIGSLKKGHVPCSCMVGVGYFPKQKDREDTLYLLKFTKGCESFIKVGRSFCMEQRIKNMHLESGYEITVISTVKSTHKTVYEIEQKSHRLLKQEGLHHKTIKKFAGSKNECFNMEALNTNIIKDTFNIN